MFVFYRGQWLEKDVCSKTKNNENSHFLGWITHIQYVQISLKEKRNFFLFWYHIVAHFITTTSHWETREWKNKNKNKDRISIKSSYMSFHGCFLLTRVERGGGQRVEEGGQRQLQSLVQSSHYSSRSEVKVSHSFYIQTAAQMIQTARFIHPVAQLETFLYIKSCIFS